MTDKPLKPGGRRRHGMSRTPEYQAWCNMRNRCNLETHPRYADYGGRDIRVCDAWNVSFEAFLCDMGPRPSARHTLERVNNELGYDPGNCVWATYSEQLRNTRVNRLVMHAGRLMSIAEACSLIGLNVNTAYHRAFAGKSDAEILSLTPLPQPKRGPRRK